MLELCVERKNDVVLADALRLPYRSNFFDAAICIAVLPHLSTVERRVKVLRELYRILRIGGVFMVTAWAFEQPPSSKRVFESQDVWVTWVTPASVQKELQRRAAMKSTTLKQVKDVKTEDESKGKGKNVGGSGDRGKRRSEGSDPDKQHQSARSASDTSGSVSEESKKDKDQDKENTRKDGDGDSVSKPQNDREASIIESKSTTATITDTTPGTDQQEKRFYHVFIKGELESLLDLLRQQLLAGQQQQGTATYPPSSHPQEPFKILSSFYDKGNWCIKVEKLIDMS